MADPSRGVMLDRLGVVASSLCAVHCILGLVLATSAGVWGVIGDEAVELKLVGAALLLAALSIAFGYRRHRRPLPLVLIAIGGAMILLSRRVDVGETALSVAGSLVLVAAHVANLRASRHCC